MIPKWNYLKVKDLWSLEATVVCNRNGEVYPDKAGRKDKSIETVKEIICLNLLNRIYKDFP